MEERANKNFRQEKNLNERIAAIRKNNARLESRQKEIALDKKHAIESGSSILPSQIKITISRPESQQFRPNCRDCDCHKGKFRSNFRPRGGDGIGHNLSQSLSRLYCDSNSNPQPQINSNRPKGEQFNERGGYGRGGGFGDFSDTSYYVRYVEIDGSKRRGKPQRSQRSNWNYFGPRNEQPTQCTITPAKSMPSLDPATMRQNSRSHPQSRGSGESESAVRLQPRFGRNTLKTTGRAANPWQTPNHVVVPPPPPPFPPPPPNQPESSVWPLETVSRNNADPWTRGDVIRSKNGNTFRVTAVGTQSNDIWKMPRDYDSPFINTEDDDDNDGYIDDNPLEDLDQFTLKVDMEGGFVVHDATICDPILAKPISSWIDDLASDTNDSDTEERYNSQIWTSSSPSTPTPPKYSLQRTNENALKIESCKSFNSSPKISDQSTITSSNRCQGGDAGSTTPDQMFLGVNSFDNVSNLHVNSAGQ